MSSHLRPLGYAFSTAMEARNRVVQQNANVAQLQAANPYNRHAAKIYKQHEVPFANMSR
jgi:hypothetical protein